MNSPELVGPDAARARLRATIARVEGEIGRLPAPEGRPSELQISWADLVEQLALGP